LENTKGDKMFTVNEYKIVFKRRWQNKCTDFNGKYLLGDGRYDTVCEIYVKDNGAYSQKPCFTGIAKLHPNDRPDKIIGKKIALRNAMVVWDHVSRTPIWKAFWGWVASWPHQVAPKPIAQKPR